MSESEDSKPYYPKQYDLAGFDIAGELQDDGTICLSVGDTVEAFPPEVKLLGVVYTLENTLLNREANDLQPSDPGYNLCWGQYV